MSQSHPNCHTEAGHVCQKPSGRACVEGCGRQAGTLWGPYWCPECDMKRLDRVSAGFDTISASLKEV
jgi:hypothetical protein